MAQEASKKADGQASVVAAGTLFRGALQASGPVQVHGTLEGEVHAPSLAVGPTGSVRGDVNVQALASAGLLAGDILAESVALAGSIANGTVISAQTLSALGGAEDGGLSLGACVLEVGPNPSELFEFLKGFDTAPNPDGAAAPKKGKKAAAEAPAEPGA